MCTQTRASVYTDVLVRGGRGTDAGARDAGRPVLTQHFRKRPWTIWGTATTPRSSLTAVCRRTPCSLPGHRLAASVERA